ncbi:cysteine proteinase [Tilletiaria anomala UBC 951]|uniref:Cysteine proteinase n=1 Tax=Tilletiaria anomala (strain ATCC 24038 / CBS 436.72 / UBC 951) TaxID=1037660 RepID=A0A066V1A9_TILAU|nr:cysteine proteinase [Tilletiaria anomala UBC 951]KDN35241.1 cysteine proteinase [Tilletiaria anomala UBC 951]
MSQTVLSFGSSSLQAADLDTLEDREWLNDNIIAFFFELMEAQLGEKRKDEAALWPPSIVELLCSLSDGEERDHEGLFPPLRSCAFLPINDRYSSSTHDSIGTHWSLLVVTDGHAPDIAKARHYDSLYGHNDRAARRVWYKYHRLIGGSTDKGNCALDRFEEAKELASQVNANDCGLYPLVFADLLLLSCSPQPQGAKTIAAKVLPKDVEAYRKRFRDWTHKWLEYCIKKQESWKSWSDVKAHVGDVPRLNL